MVDPKLALLVFAVLVAITLAVAWPRHGLWAKGRRLGRVSDRVRIEDTLKYLFHRNAAGSTVHPDALAGALEIRGAQARRLLGRVVASGLATREHAGFRLTAAGRSEALRIVRSHRILEQYFADRTGVAPAEWHDLAEAAEHELSPQEVERLASRLGQPRFDPHGDPIPTATGELPAGLGLSLTNLNEGQAGTIVHLEDEPREDYERLIGLGLALGKQVVKHGRSPDGVALELDGERLLLPHDLLDAVNVERGDGRVTRRRRTLADIERGQSATVTRVSTECRGAQRRRLLDLGVVPGTEITAEMRSPSGDPMAYRIRGALIALRQQQARWIEVEPEQASDGQDAA
jgi:DtxR family transcriptional regulator, Mn-dependent transcriptional regulator